jgi:hypothetical protein
MQQVERGFSHAMIYTSKIIDLDEERSTGATETLLQICSCLIACRGLDNFRQFGFSGSRAGCRWPATTWDKAPKGDGAVRDTGSNNVVLTFLQVQDSRHRVWGGSRCAVQVC